MTYRNPRARPGEPANYNCNGIPIDYKGAQILRVTAAHYDVVKAGVCIAQRAGLGGAKRAAEVVEGLLCPSFEDVRRFEGWG